VIDRPPSSSSAADVTTVICARDAAATIERAVRSALCQGGPVLLVDDWSSDGTADIARAVGGAALCVLRPEQHRTLGYARLAGVSAVSTPWLQWLDADDELLPDRAARLLDGAQANQWDAVWDAAELHDGATGATIRALPMPSFMRRSGAAVRLFERNHTPGPAWPLLRTAFAQQVGYDPQLPTADDLDFMLRGVQAAGRFGFVPHCGYRQFAYPSSLSRDHLHQREWVATVLRKHDYDDVAGRYVAAGFDERIASWALVSMASFRGEWSSALAFLDRASPEGATDDLLEPDGPWPFREGWRRAFHRGTLLLLSGDGVAAVRELQEAEEARPTAEGANNLGVALSRLGRRSEAESYFAAATSRVAGYVDASHNRASAAPDQITVHPLRPLPSRSEY
jgi:glycosyltransferase involved in cell wall biosynthesis